MISDTVEVVQQDVIHGRGLMATRLISHGSARHLDERKGGHRL